MKHFFKYIFFILIVKPLVLIILGLNIRGKNNLPEKGPAIIVANHNSHLDTIVLMSLFPLKLLPKVKPIAAADYFLKNKILAWFAINVIGIIPIDRHKITAPEKFFEKIISALDDNCIVILYPEGTRGEPEKIEKFKSGIAHLCEIKNNVPVYPVFLHGLGKALPKGEWILVPFFCDVFVGDFFTFSHDKKFFMNELDTKMKCLSSEFNHSITEI